MNFRIWIENKEANQFQFDMLMLRRLFPDLIDTFRDITFTYDEKQDILSLMMPVAYEGWDHKELVNIVGPVFGRNLILSKTELFRKGQAPLPVYSGTHLPEDFELPKVHLTDEYATGHYELESNLHNATKRERGGMKSLIMDFYVKAKKARDVADKRDVG